MNFCTLFDSYYLDKGIVLYESMKKVSDDFMLFVFCFDDRSYEVLNDLNFEKMTVIHHSSFENEELLKVKKKDQKPNIAGRVRR